MRHWNKSYKCTRTCLKFAKLCARPAARLAFQELKFMCCRYTMASANTISSPRVTLVPFVSADQAEMMAYPLNALPGARDVETFYGSMRVYEWGPVDGDKVLFVHGDTIPCLIFSKISQALVDAGYRVMLFGKWCSRRDVQVLSYTWDHIN